MTDMLRPDSGQIPSFDEPYTLFRRHANNHRTFVSSFSCVSHVVKNKNKLNRYAFLRAPPVPYGGAKARRFVRPVFTPLCTTAKAHVRTHIIHEYTRIRFIIRNETSDRVIDTAPRNISYYVHGATRRTRTPGRPRKSAPGDVHLYTRYIYVHMKRMR